MQSEDGQTDSACFAGVVRCNSADDGCTVDDRGMSLLLTADNGCTVDGRGMSLLLSADNCCAVDGSGTGPLLCLGGGTFSVPRHILGTS
jgi:hypothetical protein